MKTYVLRKEIETDSLKNFDSFTRSLLLAREIKTAEDASAFLNPNYESHVHDPFLLKDMDRAVERVLKAISKNEKIAIYSDYDADGIPGAVVLHDFFVKAGYKNFVNYIQNKVVQKSCLRKHHTQVADVWIIEKTRNVIRDKSVIHTVEISNTN
jgi:hypothetical protein